jgi:membrane-associated phospholipid phosphatase
VIGSADHWTLKHHVLVVSVVIGVYSLYVPFASMTLAMVPRDLALPIDHATPLVPVWVVAYACIFLVGLMPAFVVAHRPLLLRTAMAYFLIEIVSFIGFFVWPVHMQLRPTDLPVDSFSSWGLALCYYVDLPTNCFPSLHVAFSFLGALVVRRADRVFGTILVGLAVLVSVSTMLVKQHYFADVAAGLALAVVAYRVFLAPLDLSAVPEASRRFSRWVPATWAALNVATLLTLFIAYSAGWAPWSSAP